MTRRKPTKGTVDFFCEFIDAFLANAQHGCSKPVQKSLRDTINQISAAKSALGSLSALGQVETIPDSIILDPDKSAHVAIDTGWRRIPMEYLAQNFGRYGVDSISGVAEAALYTNAIAAMFGTDKLYFRGEQYFGHPLLSRAERNLTPDEGKEPGLTNRELDELKRFQIEIRNDADLAAEIGGWDGLPQDDNPRWLPIMQHYDERFGTRLLDLSTSIFTGLYFACIGWDGTIDSTNDGVLYVFLHGNGGLAVRGYYYDEKPEGYDEEMDEVAPSSVEDSFKDWKYPDVLRIYRPVLRNNRELAQDGLFLVKGCLSEDLNLGQGFKFRVPAGAKTQIARELWRAGYTPERIVRGPKGRAGHLELSSNLGMQI